MRKIDRRGRFSQQGAVSRDWMGRDAEGLGQTRAPTMGELSLNHWLMCYISAYIWREKELDSLHRSFQSQSSDQEDSEDHIRQSGGDVDSLRKRQNDK